MNLMHIKTGAYGNRSQVDDLLCFHTSAVARFTCRPSSIQPARPQKPAENFSRNYCENALDTFSALTYNPPSLGLQTPEFDYAGVDSECFAGGPAVARYLTASSGEPSAPTMSVQPAPTGKDSQIRSLQLFDGNCQVGPSDFTVSGAPTSVAQLISELDHRGIAEALVYHASASGYNPGVGNATLAAEISGTPRLHGCWVVFPHHTGEMPAPNRLVESALATGIRAVRMFPMRHRFLLADWSAGELLEKLNEHRLPLFLDYERTHWGENVVDYSSVFRICKDFPALPLILVREGIGSRVTSTPCSKNSTTYTLKSPITSLPAGLEDISRRFGAKHLLFGTGLPTYEAGPVISMLLCSEISSEQKRLVAGDNLRSLFNAVRL